MHNQKPTLLPQDRVVSRFISRYIMFRKRYYETRNDDTMLKFGSVMYIDAIITCFGDCFDLTFDEAERFLMEYST